MRLARRLSALGLLLLLASPLAAQTADQGAINRAIDRGTQFLLRQQRLDGAWSGDARLGVTALVTYTLLKSGVDPRHHAIQRAIANMETAPRRQTYDVSCLLLALSTHDPEGHAEWIQDLVDLLSGWQNEEGAFGYPSGEDLSNTQYAALGLWAAARAGADVKPRVWFKLAEAVLDFGEPYGGFHYRRDAANPTGSMTCAGIGTLAICEALLTGKNKLPRKLAAQVASAKERSLEWLGERFSVTDNPGAGDRWLHYYLYGLERVGALAGVEEIGGHDWYQEGAAYLVRTQANSGAWKATNQTCFALLFLRKATFPVTGGDRGRLGRRYKSDGGAFTIFGAGDTPLALWVGGWSPETRKKYEWPDEERQGPRVVRVVYLADGAPITEVRGNDREPIADGRLETEHEFRVPGGVVLTAQAHVLAPPSRDASGRLLPGVVRVIESGPFRADIEHVVEDWMLDYARDRGRNLTPDAGGAARASSSTRGHGAGQALDNRQETYWLADAKDAKPRLEISFATPLLADTIVIGHARTTPVKAGALGRALEVLVTVNRLEPKRVRMYPEELRKGRLELARATQIEKLVIEIPWSAPSNTGNRAVGFSEVELQLRGAGGR